MTTLTDKFSELEGQLATQAATLGGYIDTTEAKLQSILDLMDIMNENAAANTKYILTALGQTGACFPCPPPSIVVPPIGTTPGAVDSDRCKRAQAMIATIHNILAAMDTMQSFNVVGTFNVVNGAISEIVGGIAAGDTVPLPSFPEVVNITGDYISYAGERVFSGIGLIEQFGPLESALTSAMYLTGTPGAAQSQYESVIDSSSLSNGAKLLAKAVAYSALWSYFFDPGTSPDLSSYDGGVCGGSLADIPECTTFSSGPVVLNGHTFEAVILPPSYGPAPQYIAGDYIGWHFQSFGGNAAKAIGIYYYNATHSGVLWNSVNPGGTGRTMDEHTYAIAIFSIDQDGGEEAFSIEICPPS